MKNIFSKIKHSHAALSARYQSMSHETKVAAKTVLVGSAMLMVPQLAMAGDGSEFFCFIGNYFKNIVGGAALVAIFMWAIEHIFGVSKLHDVVLKVGIAAAIVIGGASIVKGAGLVPASCMLS